MLASDQMKAENAREFKYRKVNRLIIIGNGFDLAHALKTSFKHFIEDYFYQILKNLKKNRSYSDPLISITLLTYFHDLITGFDEITPEIAYRELRNLMKRDRLEIKRESDFLKNICTQIQSKSWVDIEIIFFKMLKDSSTKEEAIKKLNKEMHHLKELLKKYLINEYNNIKLANIPLIQEQFGQVFKKGEAQPKTIKADKEISSTCILNFNYTDTPDLYLNEFVAGTFEHIKIHGGLDGDDISSQGLVFGFGDELDEDYLKFENMENDELFEHIKSFKYLQFQNYRNLLEFIEGNPFQVHVYGHSLGLSDRTLLNTIFENENCISIKLFYHKWEGGDDYEQKTFAISRHFRSKASLRSKVVNKELCQAMGQFKNT